MAKHIPHFDEIVRAIGGQGRADAGPFGGHTPALARALEHYLTRELETGLEGLPLMSGQVIDINTEIDPGARTFAYRVLDSIGLAEFFEDWAASSIPMVSISDEEFTRPIDTTALGYEFSQNDMLAEAMSARNGRPMNLRNRLQNTTVRGFAEKHERVAMFGDAQRDLHGLANHPNVQQVVPTADSGSDTSWTTKNESVIITDLINMHQAIDDGTLSNEMDDPNELFIPKNVSISWSRDYTHDSTGTVISRSTMSKIREVYPNLKITPLPRLQASRSFGNLSVDRAVLLKNTPQHIQILMPMLPRFLSPQMHGLMTRVFGWAKIGGIQWWRPFSAAYMDVG